jgi:hypothetical protein
MVDFVHQTLFPATSQAKRQVHLFARGRDISIPLRVKSEIPFLHTEAR